MTRKLTATKISAIRSINIRDTEKRWNFDSESFKKEPRTAAASEKPLVQERSEVANGLRRTNQRFETQTRIGPLPLSRRRWYGSMGWIRSYRRQSHQHRTSDGHSGGTLNENLNQKRKPIETGTISSGLPTQSHSTAGSHSETPFLRRKVASLVRDAPAGLLDLFMIEV